MKEIPNYDMVEIKIYKYLTKKYLDTCITPHIVGIYQHEKCNNIKRFLNKKCPKLKDLLTKKKYKKFNDKICKFNKKLFRFQDKFHIMLLEYTPLKIDTFFEKLIKDFKSKKIRFRVIEDYILRIIFQIIFTLAHLQDNEEYFYHGDLFLRNILGKLHILNLSTSRQILPKGYASLMIFLDTHILYLSTS